MNIEQYHTADLDADSLQQLQQLEQELGAVVVALEHDPEPAELNSNQLEQLQKLEQQMGKVLVAYKAH